MTEFDKDKTSPGDRDFTSSFPYRAPLSDIQLALDVAGLDELLEFDAYSHVESEGIRLALEGFATLASDLIAQSDRVGDIDGVHYDRQTREISTPKAFHLAYDEYVRGGWGALPFPREFGGEGFPGVVGLATQEMFASANVALSLNPVLTQGVIEGLLRWGTDEQKATYLPKLLTGEWAGTMNLTESGAGSDLSEIKTRADLGEDGMWRLTGVKIFITWGDHDLTDNIVYLVLARTSEAPAGTRGLSLFLVNKRLVRARGEVGEHNSLGARRIEDKMGLHGSPTCELEFDGAECELLGPLHGGMAAMFVVMNAARLSIGAQGPAVAERAFQQALEYASSRVQGRALGLAPPRRSSIIEHPDVRRMLLTMTSSIQAARLLLYFAKAHDDRAHFADDEDTRQRSQQFVDLLTPVAKAWSTDVGFAASSMGMQVLGGTSYVEETGMAQRLRDSRIASIYEGTNGIQAIDLVTRKLPRDSGGWVREFLTEIAISIPQPLSPADPLSETYAALADVLVTLTLSTEWMIEKVANSPADALAGATAYLELFGVTVGGWLMARRAQIAATRNHPELVRVEAESNFFASEIVRRAQGLSRPITAGAARLDVPIG